MNNKRAGFAAAIAVVIIAVALIIGASWWLKTKQPGNSQTLDQSSTSASILTTATSVARKPSPLMMNACGEIRKSGTYSLGMDITNTLAKACITISTNNVILDCANHVITSKDENYAILAKGAVDFKIQNCKLVSSAAPSSSQTQHLLRVENSKRGDIYKNTLGGTYTSVSGSDSITIRNNSINNQFSVYRSNNIVLTNNVLTNASDPLHFQEGRNNSATGNTIDGRSDGIFRGATDSVGADDGIVIKDESGDVISNNIIKNVWDCGVETYGNFFDSKIIGNRISNAGYCAIGGWYYSSVKGDLIQNNVGDNVAALFNFHREFALRPTDKYVYFKDNTFDGNSLVNPRNTQPSASSILLDAPVVPASSIVVGNNVFKNNNLTKVAGLIFVSPAMILKDGGGNVCAGVTEYAERGTNSVAFNCN